MDVLFVAVTQCMDVLFVSLCRRVTLSAEGFDFMRLLPLRGGSGGLAQPGDRIEVIVPADGQTATMRAAWAVPNATHLALGTLMPRIA
jgi:hypothetical protein